jgi:hypothetical protein
LRRSGQDAIGIQELISHFQGFYGWVVVAFVGFGIMSGWFAFSGTALSDTKSWRLPWLMLTMLTAANLWFVPHLAALEGAGEVTGVYALRLLQGLAGSVLTWIGLLFGEPIWAVSIAPGVACVFTAGFVLWRRRGVSIGAGWNPDDLKHVSAFRWRVALSWISGYFLIQFSPPVLMRLGLVEDAGRMGLSLALVNMVGILALSIMTPLVPKMAIHAEGGDHKGLDVLFRKAFLQAGLIYLVIGSVLLACVLLLQNTELSVRIFTPVTFFSLLMATSCSYFVGCLALYLRAYYREPFAPLMTAVALLSIFSLCFFAPVYGVSFYVFIFLGLQIGFFAPAALFVFFRYRKVCQI